MAKAWAWLCQQHLSRVLTTLCAMFLLSTTVVALAHIARDTPWHPAAASYRRAVFFLNLAPIDWLTVANEYQGTVSDLGYGNGSVLDLFEQVGSPYAGSLLEAIASRDPQAFFEVTTRSTSHLIRHTLSLAESKLEYPGTALPDVLNAQRIFRAFGQDFLQELDPVSHKQLGISWLTLTNSVGSAGVAGIGTVEAQAEAFHKASNVIKDYLLANYEPASFADRVTFAPVPETILGSVDSSAFPTVLPPGTDLNDQDPLPLLRLNFEAKGHDEIDLPLVAFGDMLFDSPEIFGEPARSIGITCSTCHNRSDINRRAFIPGISHQPGAFDVDGAFFNSIFNDQRRDSLDTPSLRGLRFTGPYGRDGRFSSLRDFTRNVIVNEFSGEEPTPFMLDALIAYLQEFDFLPNSLINPDGSLTDLASESARRGEVIFQTPFDGFNGNSCASCHMPNSAFKDGQVHDIGTGRETSDAPGTDSEVSFDGFFETPTLLNSAFTFPYMHNGSLATLRDVANWFNDTNSLDLNDGQLTDLTSYLNAIGGADNPYEIFDSSNTVFKLAWSELTTFATTLDTILIPRQDKFHALLLIKTVAPDLRADATSLVDLDQAPLVYEVADALDAVMEAILINDWQRASNAYQLYSDLVERYGPELK
ncbi:MAG: cytochrome C [Trueperaceae bacterium]|jgi:cytochrome c peroxidase|nr:cytochrome C [Trueperaceae bacterium]